MVKYSLIIPVFNAENFIRQCLDSILIQSFNNYEIILVDDYSTDNSFGICEKYRNTYSCVKVIKQEKNLGVSSARNKGILSAIGKYILFIDSDDFVSDNYFDILEKLTENEKCDLFSFGCFDYKVFNNGSVDVMHNEMNINVNSDAPNAWNDFILKSFFLSPWNKIYKREIIRNKEILFDEKCVCYEDYLFNIEYCRYITNFQCVADPVYYYRQDMDVNHVTKRRWGERFLISEKVAKATNIFIEEKSNTELLNNLRRVTYKSYIVELEASRLDSVDFEKDIKYVVEDKFFLESIESITPRGIKVIFFLCAKKLRINFLCKILIKKMI